MGCKGSKLNNLPAVALCRHRCEFLDEAIKQRYALSQSHIAYMHSLKAIGESLNNFLDHNYDNCCSVLPKLDIPSPRKDVNNDDNVNIQSTERQLSHSDSESHLHFESDDDDDDYVHELHDDGETEHVYYMNYNAVPSKVVYEQKPTSPETMHVSDFNGYYPYHYGSNIFMPYNEYSDYSSGWGEPSSREAPLPPPSPQRESTWDFFLNPFEVYEGFYPEFAPYEEEEGMPELEDEEVVKEVQHDQNLAERGKGVVEGVGGKELSTGPSNAVGTEGGQYDVHFVDKKVVEDQGKLEDKGLRDVSDTVNEIEVQFEKAHESGNEIANILEVGRFPYNRKHDFPLSNNYVNFIKASKLLHVVSPSLSLVSLLPSTSKSDAASSLTGINDPSYSEIDEEVAMRAKNLSSILQKLYLWEKKLYNEVKAEEKMWVVHDRKQKKLKCLDEKGAEPVKVDSIRTIVRSLSTKIQIALQVVDKISIIINKIRDEELWPQLSDLIKGLAKMYRHMLECHRAQCRAIREARSLVPIGSGEKLSDDRLEATLQLEHDIINWTSSFSGWISAQKGYVRALNGWLLKCILRESKEAPDGVAPFSPSRIGAPPLFRICNQWAVALESISEKEVLDSMRVFANGILQLWEQDKLEMHQRMMANKDFKRRVKFLDKEDKKIQKEIQVLEKEVVVASGDSCSLSVPIYLTDTSKTSIQASLLHVLEAMERFTEESAKAYEELLQHSKEISIGSG